MSQQLRIAHLYPEQMNIYGDRGNIITLTQRCLWRGIEVDVVPISIGATVDWSTYDIVFFGGGQDSGQALIANDFVHHHGPALRETIDDGLVMLAICGGYQLLGHYFVTHTGEQLPGVGAFDIHTVGEDVRMIGNVVIEVDGIRAGPGDNRLHNTPSLRLVGFENHSGQTFLGKGVRPFGRVLVGHGNNGEDGTEGAIYRNAFGCYLHGSLLPKNPQFADHLITLALERRYDQANLAMLDDMFELHAQRTMINRLLR
ncbi:MAG: glutamine amidotransferase [Chloroflexi bacterium AL-W]|nr:glutamine amidotransferase [Chloroflexi bacterium AL-N1]NOK64994.1 glutamine amidotransferase [Chloroflexi bacterium AL-N10]NOK76764.1 glutamine amidotransferase [Chloroflexi bacterium AL-N5]NOK84655.1 glutamine amidotransferase [Chloroflexi bacterium AL-W]NOK86520.1 glutamine amidotransferase [Chloroflexi bacterium AL-N15]